MKDKELLQSALWDAAYTEKELADLIQQIEHLCTVAPETSGEQLLPLSNKLRAAYHRAAAVKCRLLALFRSLS